MPSLAQLAAEPWWGREIVTPELDWLGDELCRRTGRPRDAFGSKGNTVHLSGGHRSQEWIKNSDYCTNRNYTVQSGLSADQVRHIGAFDWTPGNWGTAANRALMVTHTKSLFAAARAGQLTGMRQIFGTLDGRTAIGLNVLTNSLTYPDASHLDHLHGTFDRTRMRDKALMARLADIITGDDMSWQENLTAGADGNNVTAKAQDWLIGISIATWNHVLPTVVAMSAVLQEVAKKVDLDPAELQVLTAAAEAGAKAGVLASGKDLALAVAAELSDELGLSAEDVQAAAERAVRRVLGTLDEATPQT